MNRSHQASDEIPSKLTEQQHNIVFKILEERLLSDSTHNPSPCIVIVGGQAGAGKTSLKKHLKDTLFANRIPAVIDSDSYRGDHPNFSKIMASDEKKLYRKTNEDVREWTSKLLDSALKNNRDIILEATMRNTDKMLKTIKKVKEEYPQYKIHIAVVSVHEEISRTGMMVRYTDEKIKRGFGRFVPVEAHDETYKAIPLTLRAIEEQGLIDSVTIVDRHNKKIYDHEAIDGFYSKPPQTQDGSSILCNDRSQNIFTEKEYEERISILLDGLEKLGADKKEYEVVFDVLLREPPTTPSLSGNFSKDKAATIDNDKEDATYSISQLIYSAQNDRVYLGKIVAIEEDYILQEISPDTLIEHRRDAIEVIGQTDMGTVFSISYDIKGNANVKQVSLSQERGLEL